MFRGPDADQLRTAHFLQEHAVSCCGLLRIVLIVAVILHVIAAFSSRCRAARRAPDRLREARAAGQRRSPRARCAGAARCCSFHRRSTFCTSRRHDPARRASSAETDVYGNIVASFRIWWVAAVLRGLDDRAWSAPLSRRVELGADRSAYAQPRRSRCTGGSRSRSRCSSGLGFTAIPVAVFAGLIR